ncbi:MAG TPA: carboxypeptidase-like regulatory domain-containing protein, partial [Hanamia sp.]|nr:carboxypeptidase-like regulatory domain-containing protein [Hanamia sp.]
MRIGIVAISLFITTTVQLLFALPLKSQPIDEVNIRIGLNDETLIQAFQKIEAQSPYRFMYRDEEVRNIRNLQVRAIKQSVEDFLKIILFGTGLQYRQVDNQILIMPVSHIYQNLETYLFLDEKRPPLVRQANIVNGRVTNMHGEPLAAVSITVKGTNIGTSTNDKGNYSIEVPVNGILVFSNVGFVAEKIAVSGRTNIDVTLIQDPIPLDEVIVVTAFGVKKLKRGLVYSTSEVKGSEFTEARENN